MSEIPQAALQPTQPEQNQTDLDSWQFGAAPEAIGTPVAPVEDIQAIGGSAIDHTEQTDALAPDSEQASFSFGEVQKTTSDLRTETVDAISFRTNLPEGLWPFEPNEPDKTPAHPFRRSILPSALDGMPVGEFRIGNPETEDAQYDRKIIVSEDVDGKYINQIANNGLIKNQGNTQQLMAALGYKFTDHFYGAQVEALPTPNTIQKKAAELGVDIQLFPDQKIIDGTSYLEAFVADKYPISTASAEYYLHDSRDDHLTAMVLGGEPLKAALHNSAKHALEAGLDADVYAAGIDDFTAYLRGTISPTSNNHSDEHTYGFNTLLMSGQSIGLDAETVRKIYDTARENAAKWGMQLNTPPVSLQKAA